MPSRHQEILLGSVISLTFCSLSASAQFWLMGWPSNQVGHSGPGNVSSFLYLHNWSEPPSSWIQSQSTLPRCPWCPVSAFIGVFHFSHCSLVTQDYLMAPTTIWGHSPGFLWWESLYNWRDHTSWSAGSVLQYACGCLVHFLRAPPFFPFTLQNVLVWLINSMIKPQDPSFLYM